MQLRVARLCLDCEELHGENACPVCASERYAFLSNWLPVDERRKWPRSGSAHTERPAGGVAALVSTVSNWFREESAIDRQVGPLTRRSDLAPDLSFKEAESHDSPAHSAEPQLRKRET